MLMLPHTRAMVDLLRETRGASPADLDPSAQLSELDGAAERMPASYHYTLGLKKKHQLRLLRQMLENAGYNDLAKIATVRRERTQEEDRDEY